MLRSACNLRQPSSVRLRPFPVRPAHTQMQLVVGRSFSGLWRIEFIPEQLAVTDFSRSYFVRNCGRSDLRFCPTLASYFAPKLPRSGRSVMTRLDGFRFWMGSGGFSHTGVVQGRFSRVRGFFPNCGRSVMTPAVVLCLGDEPHGVVEVLRIYSLIVLRPELRS